MDDFIYGLISSSFFTFIILMIIFVFMTRWAILERKAYRAYGLGWLLALLVMIVLSSLTSQTPEEAQPMPDVDESRVQLELFQVVFSIFLAVLFSAGSIAFSFLGGSTPLVRSLQVAAFTAMIILLVFFFFIVGDVAQRMISIFTLAFSVVVVFMQILRRQIKHSSPDANDDMVPGGAVKGDEAVPAQGSQVTAQNRVQEIREQMERNKS